jgi:hypothetical protein
MKTIPGAYAAELRSIAEAYAAFLTIASRPNHKFIFPDTKTVHVDSLDALVRLRAWAVRKRIPLKNN